VKATHQYSQHSICTIVANREIFLGPFEHTMFVYGHLRWFKTTDEEIVWRRLKNKQSRGIGRYVRDSCIAYVSYRVTWPKHMAQAMHWAKKW
jgi:hypothetical protein